MEVHKRQLRGEWIPAEILDLYENGTINATELLLLVTVDSLVHPERGCWASNDYLAGKVHCTPLHVRRMLAKLEGLALIFRTTEKNNRSITTAWSRVLPKTPLQPTPLGGYAKMHGGVCMDAYQSITERNTTESGPATPPPAESGKGDLMGYAGFIAPKEDISPRTSAQHHKDWAVAFRQALYDKGRGVTKWNKQSWANQFRQLETIDKVPAKRIDEVLRWYCAHLGEEYIPQAFAAESFRRKFVAIETAMARHTKANATYVAAGPLAPIYDAFKVLNWPNGSARDLQRLLVESYNNYESWRAKFQAFLDNPNAMPGLSNYERQNLHKFAGRIKTELGRPDVFVRWWVAQVHKKLVNWEGWDGSLPPYTWRPDQPIFTRHLNQWSKDWDGQTRWADLLLSIIK